MIKELFIQEDFNPPELEGLVFSESENGRVWIYTLELTSQISTL